MIYELSLVLKSELSDENVEKMNELVREVLAAHSSEALVQDDWGSLSFAQPANDGTSRGRFLYFIFKSNDQEINKELSRRFKISEDVLRYMVIKLGEDKDQEAIVTGYKTPYSKKYRGSIVEEDEDGEDDMRQERRQFARRKTCWFSARKIKADWKDPNTYAWLVNEFGKISPARVSSISRKHQRFANTAIKRARNIGLASHLSGRNAH